MPTVGSHELKTHTSDIIRRVRDLGEVVDITLHGEVVAHLVPAYTIKTPAEEIESLWAEMDRLAEEITANWTGSYSAVDAVREGRRGL